MTISPLRFTKLRVTKALGIGHGEGFELTDIQPGLTILHGPNGIGKSTLARVALKLLWPGEQAVEPLLASERWSGAGEFVVDRVDAGARWRMEVEAGQARASRDGDSATFSLGTPFLHDRYRLSLDDLLTWSTAGNGNQDDRFASEVLRQARGGFDLELAARRAGFAGPQSQPLTLRREVRKSQQAVRDIRTQQEPFSQLVDQRWALLEECDKLDAQLQERDALAAAARVVRARRILADRETACGTFPPEVRTLRGTELGDLERLIGKLEEKRRRHQECIAELASVQAGLRTIEMQGWERAVDHEQLLLNCRLLGEAEAIEATVANRVEECRGRLAKATSQLFTALTEVDAVTPIDAPILARAHALVDQFTSSEEARKAVEAELRLLTEPISGRGNLPDVDALRKGIDALAQWMKSQSAANVRVPSGVFTEPLIVAIVVVLLSVVGAAVWQMGVLAGAVGAIAVFFVTKATVLHKLNSAVKGTDAAGVYQQRFGTLALPAPASWSVEAVGACIEQLVRMEQERVARDERAARREKCEVQARGVEELRERLRVDLRIFEAEVGLSLRDASPQWLSLLVRNIQDWQQAGVELGGAVAKLERVRADLDAAQLNCRRPLELAGKKEVPNTAAELSEVAHRLRDRQGRVGIMEGQERVIRERERAIAVSLDVTGEEVGRFWAALQLTSGDEAGLALRLAVHQQFRETAEEAEQARRELRLAEAEVGKGSQLCDLDLEEIEKRLADSDLVQALRQSKEEELRELQHRIGGLEASSALAAALAKAAHANEVLRREELKGIDTSVGWAVKGWLHEVTKDRSVAPVLDRATRVLTEITAGRLQLHFSADGEGRSAASFLARNAGEEWRPISALSSGERVQLLLAVRLAFLEEQEQVRLPLFLDEVLGTSDDDRAEKFMDAVLRVVASGRQVFYLTAQPDEVAKWTAHLSLRGAEAAVVDLGRVRRIAEQQIRPLAPWGAPRAVVPSPEGRSHRDYGTLLGVPGIDPWEPTLESVHLWHVIEDTEILHRVLSDGIERCGQLRRWREDLAYDGLGACESSADAAELALTVACQHWRIGRGQLVDAARIASSEAVTTAFKVQVLAIVAECNGDGRRIMETLRQSPPNRWRRDSTHKLERELKDAGCLSDEEQVSREFARLAALQELRRAEMADCIGADTLDRLVNSLSW